MQFDKRTPIYEQIMQYFYQQLISGELIAGQEMPSRRELAQLLSVNPNTVQRAFKELEDQGFIVTEGNTQSRITGEQVKIEGLKQEQVAKEMDDFVEKMQKYGLHEEDIVRKVKIAIEKQKR